MAQHHETIRKAIIKRQQLQLLYSDREKTTNRNYEPMYLYQWDQHYYVSGYCHLRKALRTFKLSRIEACELLNKPGRAEHRGTGSGTKYKLLHS